MRSGAPVHGEADSGRPMTLRRAVSAERLDHLAADEPEAQRSRRDLVRVHRLMGTRAIIARAWQALLPAPAAAGAAVPLRILELGAGDGSLLLGVARLLAAGWPPVHLTLLDRQDIVSPGTRGGYAELGWTVEVEVLDVIDWASRADQTASRGPPWDLISTTLFLHHFEGAPLDALLAGIAASTRRFFACEPRRAWFPLMGSHLVGAIGANAVTREDAVLSVHAGFRGCELTALWPAPATAWSCREFAAGLFCHGFSARRTGAD
jgi:hypothetical protein